MRLSRETGRDVQVSTREDLERSLADLGAGDEDFAILTRDDGVFAQAAGSRRGGFVFEVIEGGTLLQSRRKNLSHGEVLAAFGTWLAGGDCRAAVELLDPDASDAAAGWIPLTYRHVLFVVALAIVVAGVAEWRRQRVADLVAHLEQVAGEVLSTSRSNKGDRYATVRVDAPGASWEVEGRIYDRVEVGQLVPVWFDPRDRAGTASLAPTAYRWQGTGLLFALAALILLFAAKLAHDISRRERRRARPAIRR